MVNVQFTTREIGESYKRKGNKARDIAIDVSGYGETPFRFLSPYTFGRNIELPIPRMEDRIGHSVEGVWQGLKIVNGKIDESYFTRHPKKRKGFIEGHKFGEEILSLLEARIKIYVPTYTFFLDNYAPKEALDFIREQERLGKQVFLYDTDENGDIHDQRPLAHASVLAAYLNMENLVKAVEPRTKEERRIVQILDGKEDLYDKIARISPLLKNPDFVEALRYRCTEHPQTREEYTLGQYFFGPELGRNFLNFS